MGWFGSKEKADVESDPLPEFNGDTSNNVDIQDGYVVSNADQLQRHLANRQIQLIAIGGSIGTALFVSIGTGLYNGGPGNLLIAYTIQSCALALVNNSIAEMSTAYPVSGGFIRLAGKWVDDALGFMVGWNFLFAKILLLLCLGLRANVLSIVSTKLCSFPLRFRLLVSWLRTGAPRLGIRVPLPESSLV